MKIYIFADMEGISGISSSEFVTADGSRYALGRKYLTADVSVCAKACFEAGVEEVIIRDGHGSGNHILWEELPEGVQLFQGAPVRKRFPGIEGCDGLILLGYHAMAGTRNALLEHSYSSKNIQNLYLNDQKVGEFGMDCAIAGDYDVPVIMTSGCDKLCAEAKAFLPSVVTCQVKTSYSQQGAMLLCRQKAHELIREKTLLALSLLREGKMPSYRVSPATVRTEYTERNEPQWGLTEDRVKVFSAQTVEKAYYCID